jgi:hypothetical protein
VEDDIEAASIIDTLRQPHQPLSMSFTVLLSSSVFSGFALLIFRRGREDENECRCRTGEMFNFVKRPDVYKAKSLGDF